MTVSEPPLAKVSYVVVYVFLGCHFGKCFCALVIREWLLIHVCRNVSLNHHYE